MLAAVLAVTAVLLAALPLASFFSGETGGGLSPLTSETHTVVYHPYFGSTAPSVTGTYNSTTVPTSVTVVYSGHVFSTEYNPQFWKGTIAGKGELSGSDDNWYGINSYSTGNTLVFTGWKYADGFDLSGNPTVSSGSASHYPGEIVSETDAENAKDSSGKIHIVATWGTLVNYRTSLNDIFFGGSVYTNIIELSSDVTFSAPGNAATIRSSGSVTVTVSGAVSLSYDVIVDNVYLNAGGSSNNNHGAGTNEGIMANGKTLVIGAGVNCSATTAKKAPQIYGGNNSAVTGNTNVIIHSGLFYNVVAGGGSGTVSGNTNLIMRGGTVLDTVIGGSSSGTSSTVVGNTNVYILGNTRLVGDYYEENTLAGGTYAGENGGAIKLEESTILTGGSNNASVFGSTNVHISGNASAWDVQGGGRRGQSTVENTANVTVSGNAVIKHALNGSITDGLDGNNGSSGPNRCVKKVIITVKDNATVASVFGAGYDTFYLSKYSSMYGSGSSIEINILGGTVGYVYGGGYRGTIGYSGAMDAGSFTPNSANIEPLDSITINITGGRILYDVFGGGRGGLDKTTHDASTGADAWGSSDYDTTGKSYVYVGILKINIGADAEVRGDVYGGGESTPVITSYDGLTSVNGHALRDTVAGDTVAPVYCDILELNIEGKVLGSVYGAGKGIINETDENSRHPTAYIFALKSGDSAVTKIPWVGNGEAAGTTIDSRNHDKFAYVEAENIVINITGEISGSVFGGGEVGLLGSSTNPADITVNMTSGTVNGEIYGAGKGLSDKIGLTTSSGAAFASSINVNVGNGTTTATVGNGSYSLFGTSQYAYTNVSDTIDITLGNNAEILGDVHGGGFGGNVENTSGTVSSVNIVDASRNITLNGAHVTGSIYGGSRLGNDGSTAVDKTASIYLLAGTVEYDVYGGGFQGTSYMDAGIYFGTPAVEATEKDPYTGPNQYPTLKVHSIYGGGHMSGGVAYQTTLLQGDVTINIGSSVISSPVIFNGYGPVSDNRISITGDIYGQGNYSLIGGESNVTFSGYHQDSSVPIQSLQRIYSLYLSSTGITLEGSADGGSTDLSQRLSLSRIETLTMDGSVTLDLRSETLLVKKMVSTISGTGTGPNSCTQANAGVRNTIVLSSGPILRIGQVEDASGKVSYPATADKPIEGYTYLKVPDGETYWGAFVIGPKESYVNAGFMTGEAGNVPAGDILTDGERIWYVPGHSSMTRMAVLDDSNEWTAKVDMKIPKVSVAATTDMVFSMPYVDSELQGGLYSVTDTDYIDYSTAISGSIGSASYISMEYEYKGSKGYMSTHSYDSTGGTLQPVNSGEYRAFDGEVTVKLESSAEYLSGKGSSGVVGNIVVSVTEAMKITINGTPTYIPINSIDYIVTIYIGPRPADTSSVKMNYTMMVEDSTGEIEGITHIDLPMTGKLTDYTVTKAKYTFGKVFLQADKDYLGYNGWISTKYDSSREVANSGDTPTAEWISEYSEFGEAGMKIASVQVDYRGVYISSIEIQFTAKYENSGTKTVVYDCTIELVTKKSSKLYVSYQSIDASPVRYWITATGSGTSDSPWTLKWTQSETKTGGIELEYGAVIDRMQYYFTDTANPSVKMTVAEALKDKINKIPDTTEGDKKFVYSENFHGWYIDEGTITQYNTSSEITDNAAIYAGFGIRITFTGASPTPVVIRIEPNKSLSDSGIDNITATSESGKYLWAGITVTAKTGYELSPVAWVIAGSSTEMKFNDALIASYSLELKWEPKKYTASITVKTQTPRDSFSLNQPAFTETNLATGAVTTVVPSDFTPVAPSGTEEYYTYTWKMQLTCTYVFGVNFGKDCVTEHILNEYYVKDIRYDLTVRGLNTSAMGFNIPIADGNNTSAADYVADIVLSVRIREADSIPITFVGSTDYSQPLSEHNNVTVSVNTKDETGVSITTETVVNSSSDSVVYILTHGTTTVTLTVNVSAGYIGQHISIWYHDAGGNEKVTKYADSVHTVSGVTTVYCEVSSENISYEHLLQGLKVYLCEPYKLTYKDGTSTSPSGWSDINGKTEYTEYSPAGVMGSTFELTGTFEPTVYKGFTVKITPNESGDQKYTFPQGYTVSGTSAVSLGNYVVTSVSDVIIKPLTLADVTLKVKIRLFGTDGTEVTDTAVLSKLYAKSWTLSVSVNSSSPFTFTFDKLGTYEIRLTSSSVYVVSVSIAGFDSESITVDRGSVGNDIVADLTAIQYAVNYHRYSTLDATYESASTPVLWDAVTGREDPYFADADSYVHKTADGKQTWIRDLTSENAALVTKLESTVFTGSSTSVDLYPLPDPHDMDYSITTASTVIEQSDIGSFVIRSNLFTKDITFASSGYTVSFNVTTGRLDLSQLQSGSGYLALISEDGLFRLNLTVVPSLTGAIV